VSSAFHYNIKKLKIGITYTGTDDKHNYYANWIKQNNPDIEIITLHYLEDNFSDLETCNGVVLSGGVDIHPDFFGRDTDYPNAPAKFNKRRDEFELKLFNAAKDKMPVLGICRGLQLVNVAQGGTLIKDLDNLNETHTAIDSTVADKQHEVVVEKGTLLNQITQVENNKVTSAHHQAIDELGNELQANAFSAPDNIIEGIEWKNKTGKPFMLCVQWHPERMFRIGEGDNPLTKNVRDAFINAAKSNHNS
jgi:putative glutamine amidotransferase